MCLLGIETIQRKAARFISGDYKSRDHGCVTRMLKQLELPPLQDRRKMARLTFFFKVAEGLVPAMPTDTYLTPIRGKRLIKPKKLDNYITKNIVENQAINHHKCFKPISSKSDQFEHSFFPRTIIDWNNLDSAVVCAVTVQSFIFKTALQQCY